MILWVDGRHAAGENMARDRALLAAAERGAPAVLRLFGFSPAGITLGYRQSPPRELDLERCRRDGVEWAVRPTGGRAIFHDQEWTYSLAAALDDPDWGGTLRDSFARVSALLAGSLRRLGVEVDRGRPESRPARGDRGVRGVAAPCFASTARHEVTRGGRKLVGSAQRRTSRALLQQGSVLLGPGHVRLVDYLRLDQGDRGAWRAGLEGAATAALELSGRGLAEWARALEGEIPAGALHLRGDEGLPLLTLADRGSYTPVAAHPPTQRPR